MLYLSAKELSFCRKTSEPHCCTGLPVTFITVNTGAVVHFESVPYTASCSWRFSLVLTSIKCVLIRSWKKSPTNTFFIPVWVTIAKNDGAVFVNYLAYKKNIKLYIFLKMFVFSRAHGQLESIERHIVSFVSFIGLFFIVIPPHCIPIGISTLNLKRKDFTQSWKLVVSRTKENDFSICPVSLKVWQ